MVRSRPLQIGVVFNVCRFRLDECIVIVPLQIGVVFNNGMGLQFTRLVIVPLQIGVVFNWVSFFVVRHSGYRPLINWGSL